MKLKYDVIFFVSILVSSCTPAGSDATPAAESTTLVVPISTTILETARPNQVPLPPQGSFYHGVFPGGLTGLESDITISDVRSYEKAVGKTAAWVYFSHNWFEGVKFPLETAIWIRESGSVPYIRIMPWSEWKRYKMDEVYHPQNIIDGHLDNILRSWCGAARDFGTPLLAEYGVEVNGEWFPWNGMWNGAEETTGYGDPNFPDGSERFRDSYRHIIRICREEGADNITWVFHINAGDVPEFNEWNRFEYYYPGDEWIDWIGVSNYGAQTPYDDYWETFRESMDSVYTRLTLFAPNKPIIISEFGVPHYNPLGDQAEWTRAALTDILSGRWSRIIGFSWWNERWENDNNPDNDTTMRVQDNPELADVFRELVGNNGYVLGRIEP
jgi:hypothetical protein